MKLECSPIGYIRTGKHLKFDTPHQPIVGAEERNIVELCSGHTFELGLRDLRGFQMVWLIWWFHRNENWRPLVMPPRGPSRRRGVFATRSPHRPNPIGITAVPLLEVGKSYIVVGTADLLDGTPILDIKPYLSEVDSFPAQRAGWLEEEEHLLAQSPRFEVTMSPLATAQYEWLVAEWGTSFMDKVRAVLARHPERSRTYRITGPKEGVSRMSSGGWRIFFFFNAGRVMIDRISSGYPKGLLYEEGFEVIPDWKAQRAFHDRYMRD